MVVKSIDVFRLQNRIKEKRKALFSIISTLNLRRLTSKDSKQRDVNFCFFLRVSFYQPQTSVRFYFKICVPLCKTETRRKRIISLNSRDRKLETAHVCRRDVHLVVLVKMLNLIPTC